MKKICKYPLFCLLAVFSCACQEEMVEDIDVKPHYTGQTLKVSAEVNVGGTKAYMGDKTDGRYPFLWEKEGESLVLLERASLEGNDRFTAVQNVESSPEYSLSDDSRSADFVFELQELANGDAFEYGCISPASCFRSADKDGIIIGVPSVQTPLKSVSDPQASLLWNKVSGYESQPSSLNFEKGFSHLLAYVSFDVRNLSLLPEEKVNAVSIIFDGKAVAGDICLDWNGDYAVTDKVTPSVNVKTDNVNTSGDFSVCFAAIPFEMRIGDKLIINVQTSLSVLSREIELSNEMLFPAGKVTSFGADMTDAVREVQTVVKLSSGVEYNLDQTSKGVYEQIIPYSGVGSLTYVFAGTEYGQMTSSGSGMVGTNAAGIHVSRTIGRLAANGNPIMMKPSSAKTMLVRLDVSNEDAIPRYYLELPETEEKLIFHEDFSLMTWGGDYYTYTNGVTPDMTADVVDGTEVAAKSVDYTQSSFGNKIFDASNTVYLANRGLIGWDFENCCERPYAIQVGHSVGAGSITTPAFTSLTGTSKVNIYIDIARFGTNSSGVKLSFEILGSGTFEPELCIGSRDAYTATTGTYPSLLDVPLTEYDMAFSSDQKKLSTSSNGQGKLIPRATDNKNTFKPHTRLNLRVTGADATTRIKIYGEAATARFTVFDIKVVEDCFILNGTRIDDTSTLYGLARDASTGEPIVGLPVTDGFSYAVTDANGVYQMVKHNQARCVYPSIPAEYEIPMTEDNQPQIYQYITDETQRYDFNLSQRTSSWDDFTIMAITDVHFYTKGDDQTDEEDKFKQYHVPDMNNYLASASASGEISKNVLVFSLGDNTSNYTDKLPHIKDNLYSLIQMNGQRLPMFHAIGNHDHRGDGLTDFECTQDFVNVFGPTDYSINVGNAHIVFMDNTICVEAEQPKVYGKAMAFERGITDEQWAWLQADLANVKNKENKLLILCVHAPIFGSTEYLHFRDATGLLKTFGESHIMSGHLHKEVIRDYTDVWNGMKGRLSQEYNLVALGGSWTQGWRDKISVDGTPMGYNVFNVSGNMIKEAFYNPVGQEDNYQFRIYKGSEKYENAKTITRDEEDVIYNFDWTSLFQKVYEDDTMDMSGKFVVRVFAAGTRKQYWDVYLVDVNGNRTPMQWHDKAIRDQCTLAYFYVNKKGSNGDYASAHAKNIWTIDVPEAYKSDPEKAFSEGGYKVVAEYRSPGGKVFTYESNHVQSTKNKRDYGIFAIADEWYYNGFTY